MNNPLNNKSSVDEIRARFDADVERFSQLDTGQTATMDAPLAMELVSEAAVACCSPIRRVLDIGCGAGNSTLKLHQICGEDFDVDLLDLSARMLERALVRVSAVNGGVVRGLQADFRKAGLVPGSYDVILASAVLHHLRDDGDWLAAFEKIYMLLRPGGGVWITDLVIHESEPVQVLLWRRYGQYLEDLGGSDYRRRVFEYIDREDSPRPVTYQLDLLRRVGFERVDLLHKNACFAAFGAVKGGRQV